MRKRIRAIADGKFDYKEMEIKVSESRIERMAKKGELLKGTFTLESQDHRRIRGLIYTTDRRMECDDVQFIGRKVRVMYQFCTEGMEEGDTNKGEIYIESNAGELIIPYVVSIEHYTIESSVGKIRDLYHFANLAQQNYQEAYRLFCSKKFKQIRMDTQQRMLYESLTHINVSKENMEEFLIAIHKKQPVRFKLRTSEESYECEGDSFKKTVDITKNTWGYCSLQVRSDADFVQIEKPVITSEDFAGNHYEWEFIVDKRKLHAGHNFATITFSGAVQQETLKIEIGIEGGEREKSPEEKKRIYEISRLYIQARTQSMKETVCVREATKHADMLHGLNPENRWYRLIQAHMYGMDQRREEATWLLDKFDPTTLRETNIEQYVYYQYINAILKKDENLTELVVQELRELCTEYPEHFLILLIRMFMDKELAANRATKFRMLREQFERGCHSAFLYMEACLLMKQEITVFNRLEEFEKQILNFAMKHDLFNEEMALKTAQQAVNVKQFEPILYRVLEYTYDKYPSAACVEAVCAMLIRSNKRNKIYFPWFERGVQENLKLTQLYEYYLYSIPEERQELLQKTILLYFNFESNLDYKRKAYLYANVWKHREKLGELFDQYEPRIRLFVREELLHRHINENLAYLYRQLSKELLQDPETSLMLEDMVFVKKLVCNDANIRHVVVRHWELDKEELFPIVDGVALVRIYHRDAMILLEDKEGRRHLDTVKYGLKDMFPEGDISQYCQRFEKSKQGLLLNRYFKRNTAFNESTCLIAEKLLETPNLRKEFAQEIHKELIQYYTDEYQFDKAGEHLEALDFEALDSKERAQYVELMVTQGLYQQAYTLVLRYGPESVNPKRLVRLFSRLIPDDGVDEDLLELCYYVFLKGKYDERVLEHLTQYFYGPTWQMDKLWRAAKRFDVETYGIGERILIQMLFTGYILPDSGEIFEDYYKPGFKREIVQAYLAFFAYFYVVHEQIIDERVIAWIEKEVSHNRDVSMDCRMALLKYYAGETQNIGGKEELLQKLMQEVLDKGVVLSFLKTVDRKLGARFGMSEKTIIEHRAAPDKKVFIVYGIAGTQEPMSYVREEMRSIYDSLYVKELITFYGEKVQYYIVEVDEDGAQECIVTSAVLENQDGSYAGEQGRYQMLNEMAASYQLKDEQSLDELMKRYGRLEKMTEELFALEE